ncbi:hypothetical protein E4P54_17140 [Salmonella enterica subsp. enterica serovar Panama]|uniref:hypothetical protein n=1 Tax=Enterobacteriaceae TaxID=543 RepID=UPI0014737791|nr:hypothetical protein [Salmonella enterica]EGO0259034.1 hypothetical protein [Salmonella enterica subsp. enterica serovar Panama]EGP7450263.1 hypothetical protein [Salmonella enterica subsp. enterica serovar Panama]NMF70828.1 hypothetical protein [Salmonella enterica subsp. enterica serovar Panama]NMF75552.1 hypothetical protein [Salmonella enterica subsp. enterica serovar Panama]NMF80277.1 hypothetical protein [Salmonella enterica subsp. enterica serovar Panama]
MARIRQSNPYDDVENAIRRKRDRAIYATLAVSLIFAIIFVILWFCIPSDMPVDEQVKQVSVDIFYLLRANELVPENVFDTIGAFMSIYGTAGVVLCILIILLWSVFSGDGLKIEMVTGCITILLGLSMFSTVFGDEPHNYKYNSEKISSAMQAGDLDLLYEIYGERGGVLRKSVEKAISDPKPATVKKLEDIDGLLLRGVIITAEKASNSNYKNHLGNLVLLMPEYKEGSVKDNNTQFDSQLYKAIDYHIYDIGYKSGTLTSNPLSNWKSENDQKTNYIKYIIKITALIFFILAVIFVTIILMTVRNRRRLTYLIESNIKYLSK